MSRRLTIPRGSEQCLSFLCGNRSVLFRCVSNRSAASSRRGRSSSSSWKHQQHQQQQQKNRPPKKILFQSLGCPRNFVDTEVMLGIATNSGNLQVTNQLDEADYLVVNTCGFLESARTESRNVIQDLMENKPPNSKLLVTGCMVNLHKQEILKEFPQISGVLESGAIDKIMQVIQSINEKDDGPDSRDVIPSSSSSSSSSSDDRKSFLEQGDTPRFLATPPHYAYLKIAEGCKKRCSFCIIPQIKGPLRSKPIPQVVDEFQTLLATSPLLSEVILIAQDLGDYGKDFETTNDHNNNNAAKNSNHLAVLLQALLQSTTTTNSSELNDLWLRLLYLYPDEITPQLLDVMESDARICRYLDMPIQHSHNDILRKMRRKTSQAQILSTLETLRARFPNMHIRTSLMVGFPGETDHHFEHLLQFVQEAQLDNVGVFRYSNEDRALSSHLPNQVSEMVKQERYDRLMTAQRQVVLDKNRAKIGTRLAVVVEGLNQDQEIVGRYYGQCPDIDGQVILSPTKTRKQSIVAGKRYLVEITGYRDYDLCGTIC